MAPFARNKEEEAKATSQRTDTCREVSIWTDGSCLEKGKTGASVAWRDHYWKTLKTYFSTNKEVFDGKLHVIGETLIIALRSGRTDSS